PSREKARRIEQRSLERQQFHLHTRRRQSRTSTTSLLQNQRRQHGPIRENTHNRRTILRSKLHRRLHRPGILHRGTALRSRRDNRKERSQSPLYNPSKLVLRRIQPRNKESIRIRRRNCPMDRRQRRQSINNEVSIRLPSRSKSKGRDRLGRIRRQRPTPRHWSKSSTSRTIHKLQNHIQISQQRRWTHNLQRIGTCCKGRGRSKI